MNRTLRGVSATVLVSLLALSASVCTVSSPPSPQEISGITFGEVNQRFGLDSTWTDLRKEEEWKKYKGKCVEWVGELSYLDQGLFGGISIGFKHFPHTLTYDVLVLAPRSEKDRLMKLEQGILYKYKATLRDYGVILPITADWGCE